MDFIFAIDRLKAGQRLTHPGMWPAYVWMPHPGDIAIVKDNESLQWMPTVADLLTGDWYLQKPPTQVAKPAGFIDSTVKGL